MVFTFWGLIKMGKYLVMNHRSPPPFFYLLSIFLILRFFLREIELGQTDFLQLFLIFSFILFLEKRKDVLGVVVKDARHLAGIAAPGIVHIEAGDEPAGHVVLGALHAQNVVLQRRQSARIQAVLPKAVLRTHPPPLRYSPHPTV